MLIEVAFGRVDKVGKCRWPPLGCWTTTVSEESRSVNLVVLGQERNHILPDAPGAGRWMQHH